MSFNHIPHYEYEFACSVLGGWEHWQKLCGSAIREQVKQWREELDIRIRATAVKNIMLTAYGDDKNSLQAARYLADKGYVSSGRGRPSKEERERIIKEDKIIKEELNEDAVRLGLIQGGKKI